MVTVVEEKGASGFILDLAVHPSYWFYNPGDVTKSQFSSSVIREY